MLRVYGKPDGDEGEAAAHLAALIRAAWPWVDADPQTDLAVIAGMKCYNQAREDIDLLLIGSVGPAGAFTPTLDFYDKDDEVQRPASVAVESLCVVVELKGHDQAGVKYEAGHLFVNYGTVSHPAWKDATEQNQGQVHSFRQFVTKRRYTPPFVVGLIWLRNIPEPKLPARPHNLLGSKFNWERLLSVVAQKNTPKWYGGRWNLKADSLAQPVAFGQLLRMLTATTQVSALDRTRMDRIVQAAVPPEWLELLGQKMLVLRGRGGTGKTVCLLQLAWQAYFRADARVLILTFNRALAADLRRLWTLLGFPDEDQSGVRVRTTMSYFYRVLRSLGVLPPGAEDYLERYAWYKRQALDLFEGGALGASDVARLREEDEEAFRWDYVFIDEGQDWPEDERDLLLLLFPDRPFALADGRDQLIRQGKPCEWGQKLQKSKVSIHPRERGLRMKANLTRFLNALATRLGLAEWSLEVHGEAEGGQIVVVVGDYLTQTDLHADLMERNRLAGNSTIDLLACVPYTRVSKDPHTQRSVSAPAQKWREQGQPVWDGVDEEQRDTFPSSLDQFRIVQYESCRGLEGWMAFLFGLDAFFEFKRREWHPPVGAEGALAHDPAAAGRYAARWVMIPLTRGMDTIVIELSEAHGPLWQAVRDVASDHHDYVRWIGPGGPG
jgi:hypothetical protein